MTADSKNFVLIIIENYLFKVSIVNFSSRENNSHSEEDFSRAKTEFAASFNCLKVILSK